MTAPVLALTPGDPVGIGPEITAAVLHEYSADESVHGIAVADASVMRRAVEVLGLDAEVRAVTSWDVPHAGPGVIDVFDIDELGDAQLEWGVVDARAGRAAVRAIEIATTAAMNQEIAGIVTGRSTRRRSGRPDRSTWATRRCWVRSQG